MSGNRKRAWLGGVAIAFALSAVLGLVVAARAPVRLGVWASPRSGSQGNAPLPGNGSFEVAFDPGLTPTLKGWTLCRGLADALCTYTAVPQDRLNYFSAVNAPPDYQIQGWFGTITSVEPSGGGYRVTVNVVPFLGDATVFANYSEIYRVTDGEVRYLGYTDPDGWAGRFPAMVLTALVRVRCSPVVAPASSRLPHSSCSAASSPHRHARPFAARPPKLRCRGALCML